MALSAGTHLGPYEIIAPLGAGGMGEVYRARDTKLNRDVAIKILPDAFASDADRVARFDREAQTLAALNHPHIAQIYGLEEAPRGDDGTAAPRHALVMELVDGETLADRIASGPVPVDEALPIARQIAEALEAAHEAGIVHRDLKPANIKIRPDGTVKVLDFGLARMTEAAGSGRSRAGGDVMNSPTLTSAALMTGVGVILGTAAYMSPEQAKGKPADKRSDIWAFGCVLYEMLTGTRAFEGDDVNDVLASLLAREPKLDALPPTTPPHVRRLIAGCLAKNRQERPADIAVARYVLNEAPTPPAAPPTAPAAAAATPSRARLISLAATAGVIVGGVVCGATAWLLLRPAPAVQPPVTRFTVVPPPGESLFVSGLDQDIAISPDGTRLAFRLGRDHLAIRSIDQLEPQILPTTPNPRQPFFSPDGRWIAFLSNGELRKISITGGPAITICRLSIGTRGAVWGDDNVIIFATNDPATGLLRVPAGGGEPEVLTRPETGKDAPKAAPEGISPDGDHVFPSLLPDGRGVLFTIWGGSPDRSQIAVLDLKSGQRKTLLRGGTSPLYVSTGHLVYAVAGTLRGVPFDLNRLEVVGDPAPVVERVPIAKSGAANFVLSRSGTIAYLSGDTAVQQRSLVWVDRQGQEEAVGAPARAYTVATVAPDGVRLAVSAADQDSDIWVWDTSRRTLTRLTSDPSIDVRPLWTPDGSRVIFSSNRGGTNNLFWRRADGTGNDERLTSGARFLYATAITRDGSTILGMTGPNIVRWRFASGHPGASLQTADARRQRRPGENADIGPLPPEPVLQTAFRDGNPALSPDERYFAYESNESGQFEVFVRPYPNANDGRTQVSTGGGTRPLWAPDGRELFYVDLNGPLMAVPVQTSGATFVAGSPRQIIQTRYLEPLSDRSYDISPDGKRFLMIRDVDGDEKATRVGIVVVQNWVEELKRAFSSTNR